jgi:hypothetical protein
MIPQSEQRDVPPASALESGFCSIARPSTSADSEPDQIVVSQSRRDADLDDTDSIQILLDTFNDGQNAFAFGTNPFGIEFDAQVRGEGQSGQSNRGGFNLNWDADWTVRAQTTERGWEAEFAIPLKTLPVGRFRSRLQQSARHIVVHSRRTARSFLHREIRTVVRLLNVALPAYC